MDLDHLHVVQPALSAHRIAQVIGSHQKDVKARLGGDLVCFVHHPHRLDNTEDQRIGDQRWNDFCGLAGAEQHLHAGDHKRSPAQGSDQSRLHPKSGHFGGFHLRNDDALPPGPIARLMWPASSPGSWTSGVRHIAVAVMEIWLAVPYESNCVPGQ